VYRGRYELFGETFCLRRQSRRVSWALNEAASIEKLEKIVRGCALRKGRAIHLVHFYQTIRRFIPDDNSFHIKLRAVLKGRPGDLQNVIPVIYTCKGKVPPVLNELSTTPRRRMGEWMYRSTVVEKYWP
jgi:hypothetical protein